MKAVIAIALNTYRESVRSKILYSMLVFAFLLVLTSALFGTVSIGSQLIVIENFGLFAISIFSVAYAVISGSNLLGKELQRKTIYTVLCHPVARWQFLLGKYFGMLLTVTVMIAIMSAVLSIFCYLIEPGSVTILFQSYAYIWLELAVVCAATIFFSSIVVTPLLIGLLVFGFFIVGRSSEYILYFVREGKVTGHAADALNVLYWIVPHLDLFNNNNLIVYGISPTLEHIEWSLFYIGGYAGVLLCLASIFFQTREFNS